MTRLVLDASVLVSAVVAHPGSRITRLLEEVRSGEVEMVICDHLLDEVERALKTEYSEELRLERRSELVLTGQVMRS